MKSFSAQVSEPQDIPLIAYPKAWSPGLTGTLNAEVIYVDAKDEAGLEQYKGKLKGAIVLTSPSPEVKAHFEPLGSRLDEKDLLKLADAPDRAIPILQLARHSERAGELVAHLVQPGVEREALPVTN